MTWKTYKVRTATDAETTFRHRGLPHHFDVAQKAAAVAERLGGPVDGARVYLICPDLDGVAGEGDPGYLHKIHDGSAWKVFGACGVYSVQIEDEGARWLHNVAAESPQEAAARARKVALEHGYGITPDTACRVYTNGTYVSLGDPIYQEVYTV